MEKETKNAGILGIGNLLISDEGFGVHVVEFLEEHYSFPESVTVLDGGTAGIYMAPFLEEHDPIFVVDVQHPAIFIHFQQKMQERAPCRHECHHISSGFLKYSISANCAVYSLNVWSSSVWCLKVWPPGLR